MKIILWLFVSVVFGMTGCKKETTERDLKEYPSSLYIVGDATSGLDGLSQGIQLEADSETPSIFTYKGSLKKGGFYFITTLDEEGDIYYKGESLIKDELVLLTSDDVREKFTITHHGFYTITVNLAIMEITLVEEPKNFANLYVRGSAVRNAAATVMIPDMDMNDVFHFNEVLVPGEFYISTEEMNGDNKPCFVSGDKNGDILNDEVHIVQNVENGVKWTISEEGAYQIRFDMLTMEITVTPYTSNYSKLWIVGTALESGYRVTNLQELTPVSGEQYSFYAEIPFYGSDTLFPGRSEATFKIVTTLGDWAGPYYMPIGSNLTDPLVDNRIVLDGPYGPRGDRKWIVNEAGVYKVTLNQLKGTITMEYKEPLPLME